MHTDSGTVVIYTDGGCHGNPGPGGWAAVIEHAGTTTEISGAEAATTNNRMELRAVIEALRHLGPHRPPVEVRTDSVYVRSGITEWIGNWKKRGWRTAAGKPVKNQELWRELDGLVDEGVRFTWVQGHAGIDGNERCDQLVQDAIAALR